MATQKNGNLPRRRRGSRQRISGRALLELRLLPSEELQVRVLRLCENPRMQDLVEWTVGQLRVHAPTVRVLPADPPRPKRGGPAGTPEDKKISIAKGWLKGQGHINQEVYARTEGISPATLRRWMRELRETGEL